MEEYIFLIKIPFAEYSLGFEAAASRNNLEARSAVYQIAIIESNNRIFGRAEATEKRPNSGEKVVKN